MKPLRWLPNPKHRKDIVPEFWWYVGLGLLVVPIVGFVFSWIFSTASTIPSTTFVMLVLSGIGIMLICILDRLTAIWLELRETTWLINAILMDEDDDNETFDREIPPWTNILRLRKLLGIRSRETWESDDKP